MDVVECIGDRETIPHLSNAMGGKPAIAREAGADLIGPPDDLVSRDDRQATGDLAVDNVKVRRVSAGGDRLEVQ